MCFPNWKELAFLFVNTRWQHSIDKKKKLALHTVVQLLKMPPNKLHKCLSF